MRDAPLAVPARPAQRWSGALAFLAGAFVAVVTSAGLVEERLSGGDPRVAFVANAALTCAAVLCLALIERRGLRDSLATQGLGAAMGVAIVHLALRAGWMQSAAWLVERPAQLVNDAVAVSATLAIVWAFARGMSLRWLGAALALLTAYRATGRLWHLDVPPHGFQLTVQQLVLAQFVALALGLIVYEGATREHG